MLLDPAWLETIQFVIRIILAVLCSTMVGLSFRNDAFASPIYLLLLVGMGSALLKMTANQMYLELPLLAEVAIIMFLILGISVLSASALYSAKEQNYGYKTAGAIWIAGAVGIAVAAGYYLAAIVVSVLAYLILNQMRFPAENKFKY